MLLHCQNIIFILVETAINIEIPDLYKVYAYLHVRKYRIFIRIGKPMKSELLPYALMRNVLNFFSPDNFHFWVFLKASLTSVLYCHSSILKMEAASSSETLVPVY